METISENKAYYREILRKGDGILRMVPCWVPRRFNKPGKRLRLHPDDYYALGMDRGAIVERWFSSITKTADGKDPHEGMSYVNIEDRKQALFKEVIEALGAELIGDELMEKCGTWPMYSKFYDYNEPLFHHVHPREKACKKVGVSPKHEHYYFPPQFNLHTGTCPETFFGFDSSVTKEDVIERLKMYEKGDNRILELSRAYKIELGTGWFVPAGVIHAPGSLFTYEPQWNSDCSSIWQNVVAGEIYPYDQLAGYAPKGHERDMNAIMDMIDWDLNVCPDFKQKFFRPPVVDVKGDGYIQNWVAYGNSFIGAKELTVQPGCSALIKDKAAYGCILTQGRGSFEAFECETPSMLRVGQLTCDEFFVSKDRACKGVTVKNLSKYEPLVMLKHFGPDCGMPVVKW